MPTSQRNLSPSAARLPLKDALRMLRFTVKRGRTLLDKPLAPGPSPISGMARAVLNDFDQIADRVNDVAAGLSRRFLDTDESGRLYSATLADIENIGEAEIVFAQAAYHGLTRALRHLGTTEGLVSEVRMAEAYKAAVQSGAAEKDRFALAAALMQELVKRGVVRDLLSGSTEEGDCLTETDLAKVAIFALILWFLVDRQDDEDDAEGLLLTCCDMARALKSDLAESLDDAERLQDLIAAYVDKI
ncbi:hypothetical protein HBA54_08870 [Pelagibius litoralis]|uniref:Uncharacterized protein n=1 Tax=Pelagibius litoralis TaxID=374515 RepID=A0A967EVM4_9PROT|nr:hypothetical protein [Pelagibius litoralis]NIA68702.1 hypothetical protein [Pelagibius litoralis]